MKSLAVACFLLLAGLYFQPLAVYAEDSTSSSNESSGREDAELQKTAAINTLLKTMGFADLIKETMNKAFTKAEAVYRQQMEEYLLKKGISEAEAAKQTDEKATTNFAKAREALEGKGYVRKTELAVTLALDEHMTTPELEFLINYHQSPVGKRSRELTYEFAEAGRTAMASTVNPYLKKLEQEIEGGPPAGKFEVPGASEVLSKVSPDKKELIEKLMTIANPGDATRESVVRIEEERLAKVIADPPANVSEEARQKYIDFERKFIDAQKTRIDWNAAFYPAMVDAYDRHCSVQDLEGLVEFYSNPRAQEINNKLSVYIVEALQSMQKLWLADFVKSVGEIDSKANQ